jgi:hypothetical protein
MLFTVDMDMEYGYGQGCGYVVEVRFTVIEISPDNHFPASNNNTTMLSSVLTSRVVRPLTHRVQR